MAALSKGVEKRLMFGAVVEESCHIWQRNGAA